MKINFAFGFNGGQLLAECATFEEADQVLDYALKRGVITVTVQTPEGPTDVSITKNEEIIEKAKSKAAVTTVTPSVTPEVTNEAPSITPADAAQAVKDYAAKHGVEAGRALLAKFNLKRTSEINDANAAEVAAAARG